MRPVKFKHKSVGLQYVQTRERGVPMLPRLEGRCLRRLIKKLKKQGKLR